MKLRLDYGRDGIEVDVPDQAQVLHMADVPGLQDIEQRLDEALRHPLGTTGLRQLAQGRRDACIVISDITRPVPNAVILAPMLKILEEEGIEREKITILVATGLHRPNEGEELVALVGADIARDYRIVNHKAKERDTLVHLGETSGGAPIWIDRLYVEADLKIATSLIEPHLMAGYSGGRKAICPGLMGVDTMRVLHGPDLLSHPNASEGIIEGNPFHRQALEVAQRAGVDFTLNVAMNAQRQITGIFCGDLEKAHAAGVAFVEKGAAARVPQVADIVLTSSAGHPLDLTFYQAVKGMTAAMPVVRPGGTLIIAAECSEGLGGPEFSRLLLETEDCAAFERRLEDPDFFVVDQWQLQEMCKVARRASIVFASAHIDAEYSGRLPVETAASPQAALQQAFARYGEDAVLTVIPKGPYVLTQLEEAVQ